MERANDHSWFEGWIQILFFKIILSFLVISLNTTVNVTHHTFLHITHVLLNLHNLCFFLENHSILRNPDIIITIMYKYC